MRTLLRLAWLLIGLGRKGECSHLGVLLRQDTPTERIVVGHCSGRLGEAESLGLSEMETRGTRCSTSTAIVSRGVAIASREKCNGGDEWFEEDTMGPADSKVVDSERVNRRRDYLASGLTEAQVSLRGTKRPANTSDTTLGLLVDAGTTAAPRGWCRKYLP